MSTSRARNGLPRRTGLPSFAFPVKMSNFAFEVGRESPKPGEHTIAVLRDFGFSGEEIARLEAQHVV
jgi:crotonobetainyl-CoA:carnitine CoA-transferase CaiB-like acyl-CoA transferase